MREREQMKYSFHENYWTVVDERQSNLLIAEIIITSTGEFRIDFKSRYDLFADIGILHPGNFSSLNDAKAYVEKLPTIGEFEATICKLFTVAKESDSVNGYHQNGEKAPWAELINVDHLYL